MAPDDRPPLRVHVTGEDGRQVDARGLARWLARVAPSHARGAVGVALVGDSRVRILNKDYRRRDYATDVLSFPCFPSGARTNIQRTQRGGRYLGDIVIARGIARRQAREAGHSEA